MAGAMVRIPVIRRSSDDIFEFPGTTASLADMVLGFIEEVEVSPENTTSGSDEDDENSCSVEENKAFWEEQDQLLQVLFQFIHTPFYLITSNKEEYMRN